MPVTPGVVALTILSSAVQVASSMQQSRNSRRIAEYQNAQQKLAYEKTLAASRAQGELTAVEKRRQIQNRYDAYRGAMAVSAAERGAGGRTQDALASALSIQVARESAKVSMEQELNMQSLEISATPQWQVGQSSSAFLAGIQGGLQGLSMGMSLMQGQEQLELAQATARAQGIKVN